MAHLAEALAPKPNSNKIKLGCIRKLMQAGKAPIIVKLIDGLTKQEAAKLEVELIAELGTKVKVAGVDKRGPLANLHAGGIGGYVERSASANKAISEKLKGRKISWAGKVSAAKTGVPITPEHAAKLHAGGKNRIRSAEENAKRGAAISAANTPEVVAKRTKTRRQNGWYSQEALDHRAELVASGALKHTEETKQHLSAKLTEVMANPEIREKMRKSAAKRWSDPAEAEKIRERNSKTYELVHRETGERVIVKNMSAWCRQNGTYQRKVWKEFAVREWSAQSETR